MGKTIKKKKKNLCFMLTNRSSHMLGRSARIETLSRLLDFYNIIAEPLNERISEWAHFLNLDKRFQRYLNFSAPKNGVFLDKA